MKSNKKKEEEIHEVTLLDMIGSIFNGCLK